MQFHSVVMAVAATSAAVVKATPPRSTQSALPEGYEIEPMAWRGIIERGGREFSFNGTIDEVTRQIKAINTDFTWSDVRDFQASGTRPQERSSKVRLLHLRTPRQANHKSEHEITTPNPRPAYSAT
ncbi:hypothetical protein EKO27_g8072 [Xylaria grammica]|uniref:Uncharacterized protein n=1 Tax=Xylaria grammica TaxID=363999 RepID=A0A439CY27_9PEZI|nr:hypothetical protein EKO27_g8072 [Xylaria grammica]